MPALNSFFTEPEREHAADGRAARLARASSRDAGALVLVTHQVVITALTGIVPASGEIVVVRATQGGDLRLVGRIPAPD